MQEPRETDIKKPVEAVVSKTDVEVMRSVASSLGISVSVLANEGETYIPGQKDKVRTGGTFVQIVGGSGKNNDLSEFWKKVEETRSAQA